MASGPVAEVEMGPKKAYVSALEWRNQIVYQNKTMWHNLVGWCTEGVWCAKHLIAEGHVARSDSRSTEAREARAHLIQRATWPALIG